MGDLNPGDGGAAVRRESVWRTCPYCNDHFDEADPDFGFEWGRQDACALCDKASLAKLSILLGFPHGGNGRGDVW